MNVLKDRLYSRTNQQLLDGTIVGISFCLAYLIANAGRVPSYRAYQFWLLLILVAAGRLLLNFLFGLHRIQWRYVSLHDALRTARTYLVFSVVLVLIQFLLPASASAFRIPFSVITMELLLSLLGAMGIRALRRYLYEAETRHAESINQTGRRRLLLIGAGMMGVRAAKEMASDPSVEIIGFLDDDSSKFGCVISGAKVLGPTSLLTKIVQTERIDSVLICIAPSARGSFNRLVALLDSLPVTSRFVPTMTEILNATDGIRPVLVESTGNGNGHFPKAGVIQDHPVEQRSEIRDKTILITGGAGFIGSTLAERLADHNQVILLDRFFHNQPVSFTGLCKHPNVQMVEGDILEGVEIEDLASEADIVVHAAAIVGVGRVCTYPRETLETNFAGTLRVLKAVEKNHRLERFVYFSTSEVFGVNSFRVQEDAPTAVGPAAEARWSYAIAKLAGEHLIKAYHRQAGIPAVTVRPFNVFGPRRLGANAVSGFILNALQGMPIEVHGDGSQIRSWCYIDDFCDALIEMIARPRAVGEDFNIGNPGNTVTILQLARQIVELTGSDVPIVCTESPFPDIEIRVPSLTKARKILGFRPAYEFSRGLELTTAWYQENLDFFERKTLGRADAAVSSR